MRKDVAESEKGSRKRVTNESENKDGHRLRFMERAVILPSSLTDTELEDKPREKYTHNHVTY